MSKFITNIFIFVILMIKQFIIAEMDEAPPEVLRKIIFVNKKMVYFFEI